MEIRPDRHQRSAEVPEYAAAHVGLANAWILQFEATRADARPDEARAVALRLEKLLEKTGLASH